MNRNGYVVSMLKKVNRKNALRRFVAMLSVIVLLVTVNSLKLDADTLERIPACGVEAHTHTDACNNAAGEPDCGLAEHVHTDACYQSRPVSASIEQPVEEMPAFELGAEDGQTIESETVDPIDADMSASDDIEIPPEESGVVVLDDAAEPAENAPLESEKNSYIVGDQYPFHLSDVIAEVGLNLSIDDITEIRQAV